NSKNELVIGSRKVIVLNTKGSIVSQFDFINYYLGPSFMAPNKTIHFHFGGSDSVLVYANGFFLKHRLKVSPNLIDNSLVLKLFSIGGNSYALDSKTNMLYSYIVSNFELTPLPRNRLFEVEGSKRIYETGNEVWIAGTLPGVSCFNNSNSKNQFMYGDHFISNVYKDHEGNILLSTFDKGVLVIPDLKVPDVIHSFRDDPVTALYPNNNYGLIMGTSKGKLMNYLNGELHVLKQSAKRSVEAFYGNSASNFILFDNGGGSFYNLLTGEMKNIISSSLKDAVVVSESKYFIGTNIGIYEMHKNSNNQFSSKLIERTNYRVYAMEYDFKNAQLYSSTANGFFRIDSLGHAIKILYNGEDIFSNSLYEHQGKIYVCTEKNGVLVIAGGKIFSALEMKANGKAEQVKKMLITNNTIIANSVNGFFQYTIEGKLLKSISAAFGFSNKKVIDFKMMNEQLWVSHSGGVQCINLNQIPKVSRPDVRFDRIAVNDKLIDEREMNTFRSNQRKVQFVFASPTLKNKEAIKYHYKLIGYDTAWTVNNFELNQVTYNALDAGNYAFIVKAENQGLFSNIAEYSFTIAKPVYLQWWFILIFGVIVSLLIVLIYRWQLRLQQKKSGQINELNASKLAAIQSQMNPHFIFNSLNSIQDLVLKGDVENSYSYITTFSDLVRRTLNYSKKDFIEFEQEIKLLNLYLSLEKLRFKKNFTFEINTANVEGVMIPPMLIQPFIENSLAHGLLHKVGEKKLKVSFELAEMLVCRIEDNGIGREKAKEIKQRQSKGHKSFSGNAIGKRLEILSHVFEGEFGYMYEDLYDNGESNGTRVVITIPIKRKF
ncbi:MAG: histidine kinase, partial [Bacteroidota bacterium]|nr:histidine kinase [Bacteroidota bacterium]